LVERSAFTAPRPVVVLRQIREFPDDAPLCQVLLFLDEAIPSIYEFPCRSAAPEPSLAVAVTRPANGD
jgi:hypothetical protein